MLLKHIGASQEGNTRLQVPADLLLAREAALPMSGAALPIAVIVCLPTPNVGGRDVCRESVAG